MEGIEAEHQQRAPLDGQAAQPTVEFVAVGDLTQSVTGDGLPVDDGQPACQRRRERPATVHARTRSRYGWTA